MEMLAKAPETFTVRGRNPDRAVTLGGGSFVLTPVGGSPFCSDLERGRREGSMRDYLELVKMTQAADLLTCQQSGVVEASDLDDQTRHMDMDYAVIRWSDKPYVCYGTSGPKARDAVNLAAIACGGRDQIEQTPGLLGVVNPNSPLVWDWLMADALMEWATANQPVVVTPFLLAGATAPVSIAGGLAQQVAEALSGVALAQTVRPGAPCVFGSFFSAVDMRTGGPSFGTPESVLGCIAGGQLARRYKIPFRGGGGLCSGNALDAQAASESLNMLWATFMAGSDLVMHAAGWLEGGLTASYEKLALDLEVLRMFVMMREGIGIGEEEFAIEAIREEGPGGMFLGSMHTLEHFRDWVFMSPLFKSQAYVTWEKQGAHTADQQATARVEARCSKATRIPASTRRSTRSCRSTSLAAAQRSRLRTPHEPARAPRHPVRAGPDRTKDASKPLLPGAALHRVRRREAVDAGGLSRDEGRGRMGGGVHRVLLDQPRV